MNSKEALESIKNTKTNHIKNEKLGQPRKMYLVKELKKEEIETIKQDLDRLEKLEKDYEKLKERYKHRAETSSDLCEAVKQYEKAFEILKDKMSLILFDYPPYEIWLEKKSEELTQEEYNLLKEVLGNE